jgi:uncharacterized protein
MTAPQAQVVVAAELAFFLKPGQRDDPVVVTCDGVSTLGHVVESIGIPLTEVGSLAVDGQPVDRSYRLRSGNVAQVSPVPRPQGLDDQRFLLDVHLGTVARRMRLLGIDTAYHREADDDDLIEEANDDRRILLTQDRGLLRRRMLWLGAYVRGDNPDGQLEDVLDRFAPPLAPWTRCTACNGQLATAAKADVERELQPGTRRTYDAFARCQSCGRVYWRGAHGKRLEATVETAIRIVGSARRNGRGPANRHWRERPRSHP